MIAPHELRAEFRARGYAVAPGVVNPAAIDLLLERFTGLVRKAGLPSFKDPRGPVAADLLAAHPDIVARVYDEIRQTPWLAALAMDPGITALIGEIIQRPFGLLRKLPFRIDVPRETKEIAVWHQDYFYVRGSRQTITAWIPLQDTSYLNGCLLIMPGSHELGPLGHDGHALGKRHFPTAIFGREVRYIELRLGDALFFDACLLHSSGVNLSPVVRYSLNARFAPLDGEHDPGMGGILPIEAP